ncbi:MAG: hypothetical protein SFW09_18190, partial [Hyphomicrobiaceae bacterium]|nr:hypothetical protein [Hyphomicrobiaceae bacterium]
MDRIPMGPRSRWFASFTLAPLVWLLVVWPVPDALLKLYAQGLSPRSISRLLWVVVSFHLYALLA